MSGSISREALAGLRVVEVGPGIAAAYCGRLLADCGATVARAVSGGDEPLARRREIADDPRTEGLLFAWLTAGKETRRVSASDLPMLCGGADIVICGEDSTVEPAALNARCAVIDIRWFARNGPMSDWKGSDIAVQAMTGMMELCGPEEGPPMFMGDCQATLIGGLTAQIAAMVGVLAPQREEPRRFDVSIMEANLALSELQLAYAQAGNPARRAGVNRFDPNSPIGIFPCREGWLGLTALTPAQWQGLCEMLGMDDLAADPVLAVSASRHAHVAMLEKRITAALAARTAVEWAEEGRRRRVPMAPVPDAQGILDHPVFAARESLSLLRMDGRALRVPRTPFAMTSSPTRVDLDEPPPTARFARDEVALAATGASGPLAGIRVADFSMGWAGPLATRILADFGAEIVKFEAGRYPDWWRSVDWAPEAIAREQYEGALHFSALNRGKLGTGIDLTTPGGRDLALRILERSDAMVENQAADVLARFGLDHANVSRANPGIVMMSMSAFGAGNAWSQTRAYGSTLEHASGLPSFAGEPGTPPAMAHLAYGDAVGGLYGCGALLTALVHRRRSGEGQFVNLCMVEGMLQFTAPALLVRQATGAEPPRRGNRHPVLAPHGCFAAAGRDEWVALAAEGETALAALGELVGCDRVGQSRRTGAASRGELVGLERAVAAWMRGQDRRAAVRQLQGMGISAAPVLRVDEIATDPYLATLGFFFDLDRPVSGLQRQCGLAIAERGVRFFATTPAPRLGGDTQSVLARLLGTDEAGFARLLDEGAVSRRPTTLRGAAAS